MNEQTRDTVQRARDFLAGREPPPFYWELAQALIEEHERAERLASAGAGDRQEPPDVSAVGRTARIEKRERVLWSAGVRTVIEEWVVLSRFRDRADGVEMSRGRGKTPADAISKALEWRRDFEASKR
jgi:hypothetical protein